jgi:hypothetical protein
MRSVKQILGRYTVLGLQRLASETGATATRSSGIEFEP